MSYVIVEPAGEGLPAPGLPHADVDQAGVEPAYCNPNDAPLLPLSY